MVQGQYIEHGTDEQGVLVATNGTYVLAFDGSAFYTPSTAPSFQAEGGFLDADGLFRELHAAASGGSVEARHIPKQARPFLRHVTTSTIDEHVE